MSSGVIAVALRARYSAALALVGATALIGCGGEDPERARVERYIDQANTVQREFAPQIERANKAYVALSKGNLDAKQADIAISGAEQTLRDARGRVAGMDPPAAARTLHRRLLRVFDLNAAFAEETTALARYVPAARENQRLVERLGRRLRAGLRTAGSPSEQAQALSRYVRGIERRSEKLRRLQPPPVLVAAHRLELSRLLATVRVARKLRAATEARDSPGVARLLIAFRRAAASADDPQATRAAISAYNERYRAITAAVVELRQEQARVEQRFS